MADRPVGFGRREDDGDTSGTATVPGSVKLDDAIAAGLLPERPKRASGCERSRPRSSRSCSATEPARLPQRVLVV